MVKNILILIWNAKIFLLLSTGVGSTIEMDKCYQKPSTCTLQQLCKRAMYGDIYDMTFSKRKYALEAKDRFLTPAWCKKEKVEAACSSKKLSKCTNAEICKEATYINSGKVYWWASINLRVLWAEEAQKRSLPCDV